MTHTVNESHMNISTQGHILVQDEEPTVLIKRHFKQGELQTSVNPNGTLITPSENNIDEHHKPQVIH